MAVYLTFQSKLTLERCNYFLIFIFKLTSNKQIRRTILVESNRQTFTISFCYNPITSLIPILIKYFSSSLVEGVTHWSIKCQGATRTTGAPFVFMLMLQNGQLPRSLFTVQSTRFRHRHCLRSTAVTHRIICDSDLTKQRDKYPAASVRPGNSIKLCGDLFNI